MIWSMFAIIIALSVAVIWLLCVTPNKKERELLKLAARDYWFVETFGLSVYDAAEVLSECEDENEKALLPYVMPVFDCEGFYLNRSELAQISDEKHIKERASRMYLKEAKEGT